MTVPPFVCPACRVAVSGNAQGYDCAACGRHFPLICGIPDFRIRPDRYLSIDEERAKATRLHDYARHHDFAATVAYYYAITDDVPPAQARAFARYVREGVDRARAILTRITGHDGDGPWLDAGCGSGGALIAAQGRGAAIVGVDIAMRWLVIAQKQLAESGAEARLVCADIEALPFAEGSFSFVLAEDLVEHAYDSVGATRAIVAQLRFGGHSLISAINGNWPGPHPAVGVWAAGWMPAAMRRAVTLRLRGVDAFRNLAFVTPGGIAEAARSAGATILSVAARPANARDSFAARCYEHMRRTPGIGGLLAAIGPAFEIQLTNKGTQQ